MYVSEFIGSRRLRNSDLRGSPLATDYGGKSRTFEPFSHNKKLVMLGIEPTHTMLRSGRSTHRAVVTLCKQTGSNRCGSKFVSSMLVAPMFVALMAVSPIICVSDGCGRYSFSTVSQLIRYHNGGKDTRRSEGEHREGWGVCYVFKTF